MRTLSLCAVISLLIASASAQQIPHEAKFFSPWTEDGFPTFRRAVTGYLGEDGLLDAVVVRDLNDQPAAFYQPNVHRFNASYEVGTQARDAAILPQAAPGSRDALLVLTSAGLELHWAATGQSLQLIATEGDPSWQTAQRVWVVKSQAGAYWILGLDASASQVLRLTWNGVDFVGQPSFTAPGGLSDVQWLDYDGGGENELLLWSDPFAIVTLWDGTPIAAIDTNLSPNAPLPLPYRRSAVVSRGETGSGNPLERDLVVLHIYWDVTGDYYAVPFNSDVAPYMIPLSGVAANHQTAADVDGDGLQDVLLSRSDRSEVFVLRRTNDTIPFATAGAPNLMSLVVPDGELDQGLDFSLTGDFDGDGDTDLLAFQSAFAHVHSFYGSVVSGRRPTAKAPGTEPYAPGIMTWDVQRPADWAAIVTESAGGSLRIRIEGWVQPKSADPILSARRIDEVRAVNFSPTGAQSITFTYDATGLVAGDYVLQLHTSIECLHGGVVTKAYPSSLTYYTPNFVYSEILSDQVLFASTGSLIGPSDGDGSVDGNRGNKPPPSPPPD